MPVVGQDRARADEHAVPDRHAVVDERAVLDLDPVAEGDALVDEHVAPDDPVTADPRPGPDLGAMPDAGPGSDADVSLDDPRSGGCALTGRSRVALLGRWAVVAGREYIPAVADHRPPILGVPGAADGPIEDPTHARRALLPDCNDLSAIPLEYWRQKYYLAEVGSTSRHALIRTSVHPIIRTSEPRPLARRAEKASAATDTNRGGGFGDGRVTPPHLFQGRVSGNSSTPVDHVGGHIARTSGIVQTSCQRPNAASPTRRPPWRP